MSIYYISYHFFYTLDYNVAMFRYVRCFVSQNLTIN